MLVHKDKPGECSMLKERNFNYPSFAQFLAVVKCTILICLSCLVIKQVILILDTAGQNQENVYMSLISHEIQTHDYNGPCHANPIV